MQSPRSCYQLKQIKKSRLWGAFNSTMFVQCATGSTVGMRCSRTKARVHTLLSSLLRKSTLDSLFLDPWRYRNYGHRNVVRILSSPSTDAGYCPAHSPTQGTVQSTHRRSNIPQNAFVGHTVVTSQLAQYFIIKPPGRVANDVTGEHRHLLTLAPHHESIWQNVGFLVTVALSPGKENQNRFGCFTNLFPVNI